MSRWQKTCGNAFNLAVFSSRKSARSALGHKRHGRFPPESGHVRCNYGCPLCANSGHRRGYSITERVCRQINEVETHTWQARARVS